MSWPTAKQKDIMREEWKLNGGSVHGPNVETVTMPEEMYFKFRADLQEAYQLGRPSWFDRVPMTARAGANDWHPETLDDAVAQMRDMRDDWAQLGQALGFESYVDPEVIIKRATELGALAKGLPQQVDGIPLQTLDDPAPVAIIRGGTLDAAINAAVADLEMIAAGRDTVSGDELDKGLMMKLAESTHAALSRAWDDAPELLAGWQFDWMGDEVQVIAPNCDPGATWIKKDHRKLEFRLLYRMVTDIIRQRAGNNT